MVLLELQSLLGVNSYITRQCRDYMEAFFAPETITLPALTDEFCNPQDILSLAEPFSEHFEDFVKDPKWRKGKIIEFYPLSIKPGDKDFLVKRHRWLRPEDQGSPLQEQFNQAYVKHLRENMSFKDNIKEKIDKRLRSLAKKFYNKKSKDVTYVGVHIRRSDYLIFEKKIYEQEPLKSDYYNNAMESFR